MDSKTDSSRSSRRSETEPFVFDLDVTDEDSAALDRLDRAPLGPEEFQRLLDAVGEVEHDALGARPVMDGEPFSL